MRRLKWNPCAAHLIKRISSYTQAPCALLIILWHIVRFLWVKVVNAKTSLAINPGAEQRLQARERISDTLLVYTNCIKWKSACFGECSSQCYPMTFHDFLDFSCDWRGSDQLFLPQGERFIFFADCCMGSNIYILYNKHANFQSAPMKNCTLFSHYLNCRHLMASCGAWKVCKSWFAKYFANDDKAASEMTKMINFFEANDTKLAQPNLNNLTES